MSQKNWRLVVLLLALCAGRVLAHNPMTSWAVARLQEERVELEVELSAETAWALMGGDTASAPDVAAALPRLKELAPGLYRVSAGGRELTAASSEVELREEDGVGFLLVYQRPADAPLRFDAAFLKSLPAEHRTALTLKDATDKVLRTEVLTASNLSVAEAGGVATLPFAANTAAGTYAVTAQFTSANASYLDGAGASSLVVTRENAATSYTGDAALLTAGPNVGTAAVRLGAHLTPESDGAESAGDISKATVTFELFKSSNASGTPDLSVSGVSVDASGDALVTVEGVAAETYSVNVRVDGANQFWTANPVGLGVLDVAVPTDERRSGGGGWVADSSSANGRANFGFNVSPGNRDGQVRGNFTLAFRGSDGFNYLVKGNSWQDGYLQFSAEPGTSPAAYARSNLKGRCNVQKVDPATGQVVASWGNYTFEAFTADGDALSPRQPDAFSFVVNDAAGQGWHKAGSRTSLVTLGGGNVTNKAQ